MPKPQANQLSFLHFTQLSVGFGGPSHARAGEVSIATISKSAPF